MSLVNCREEGGLWTVPRSKSYNFVPYPKKRKSLASGTMYMKCVIIEIANPGKKNLPILRVLVDLSRSKHILHGIHQLLFLVLSYLDGFDLNANTRRCGFTRTIFVNRPSREKVVAGNEKYCKCTESLAVEFEKMPEYSIFRKTF